MGSAPGGVSPRGDPFIGVLFPLGLIASRYFTVNFTSRISVYIHVNEDDEAGFTLLGRDSFKDPPSSS